MGLALTPYSAIRDGAYKLIFDWYGRLYLFDIESDPYEENNLADAYPIKTRVMTQKLLDWLSENIDKRYWPRLNADYKPEEEVREERFVDILSKYEVVND